MADSQHVHEHIKRVDPASAFIGGALMLMGSRMGGGCTSGHGLSGMAALGVHSTVAVCGMFGAGVLVSFIAQYGVTDGGFYSSPAKHYSGCD